MSSTRSNLLRLLLYGLVVVVGLLLFVRPDLLGRLGGATEAVDPCREPLVWHIRDIDPRFGFSPDEVARAVREAASVWEAAAGRRLFRRDTAGMAIDLVYDDRQRQWEEGRVREADLAELQTEVERLESRLTVLRGRAETARRRHEDVRSRSSMEAYGAAVDRYNRAIDRYNWAVTRYNEALEEARAQGGDEVAAGNLRSERRTLGGRVMQVERELTVAVAGDYEHLVVVLSHELGHALGLGHVADPSALMAESYRRRILSLPVMLARADLVALAGECEIASLPD